MAVLKRAGINRLACGRSFESDVECYVQCDVHDRYSILRLMETFKPTHFLHAAWGAGFGYAYDPSNYTWLETSKQLIEDFYNMGGKRFVGLGTCVEYHNTVLSRSENCTPTQPDTLYGEAKLATGKFLAEYALERAYSHAWCRLFYIYGPGEALHRLLPSACASFMRVENFTTAALEHKFDYMDVRDVAEAVITVLLSNCQGVINVASGKAHSVKVLLENMAQIIGTNAHPKPMLPVALKQVIVGDSNRLRSELQFYPRYTVQESLKDIYIDIKERLCAR